jgi:HAD superfamily hydrolase (TIGR01549 family)
LSIRVRNPEKFADRPHAVFFDLDNTLYPYQPSHEAGMAAVREKAGKSLGAGPAEFDDAFAKARTETKNRLGTTASSHSRLLYFQRTLEHLGFRSQAQLNLEFEQTYWNSFLFEMERRDGVLDFLDLLARASVPKVIITDLTTGIQLRKLVYLELDRFFEFVITSEESGADKPDRSSFDLAITKLSMLDRPGPPVNHGSTIWMIGDNLTADIEGAKNAIDATTLALKSEIGDQANHAAVDMVFDSFTDLEQFVTRAGWDKSVRESL